MPVSIHTTVTFESLSGLPEDVIVSQFNFIANVFDTATIDNVQAAMNVFYTVVNSPGTQALGVFLGLSVSRTVPAIIDIWDSSAGPPFGSPDATRALNLLPAATVSTNALPREVSVCLSYRADVSQDLEESGTTRPRARKRGRIFFGPLNIDSTTQVPAKGIPEPSEGVRSALLGSANYLLDHPDLVWSVWSRASNELNAAVLAHVDNAFDTQRRRGEAPSSRAVITRGAAPLVPAFQPAAGA